METRFLNDEYEYVEVRKDAYQKLELAIKEMNLPVLGVTDFIEQQIKRPEETQRVGGTKRRTRKKKPEKTLKCG